MRGRININLGVVMSFFDISYWCPTGPSTVYVSLAMLCLGLEVIFIINNKSTNLEILFLENNNNNNNKRKKRRTYIIYFSELVAVAVYYHLSKTWTEPASVWHLLLLVEHILGISQSVTSIDNIVKEIMKLLG